MVRFLILFVSCLCISPGSSQVFGAGKRAVTPQSVEAFFDVAFETQKLDHELLGVTVSYKFENGRYKATDYWFEQEAPNENYKQRQHHPPWSLVSRSIM